MVVYILVFEHIQWRWALNDFTAPGCPRHALARRDAGAVHARDDGARVQHQGRDAERRELAVQQPVHLARNLYRVGPNCGPT